MKLLDRVLSTLTPPTPEQQELSRRLRAPQRHRLLQGYPMRRLMAPVQAGDLMEGWPIGSDRRLIVGVLPHAFCNPKVRGCGFCTFPHEPFRASAARETADAVVREIRSRTERLGLTGREVDAVYFGGATANLTPPDRFERLCAALVEAFDLDQAEVTLEGVPVHFLSRRGALLSLLGELPVRQRRISMGVQTFDPGRLREMGREAFGTRAQIERVISRARGLGMTTSADLLINLPGQTGREIEADLAQAVQLGLDQICVYHLVLFRGLGTAWSEDPAKLKGLPDNERAYRRWRAARAFLLERGYVQTTLTNFERADVKASARRFRYEACSFQARRYDGIGFGPSAISCFADDASQRALKLINASGASRYVAAMNESERAYATRFEYQPRDARLLHITRSLSALQIRRAEYRGQFGTDAVDDFRCELEAIESEGLVEVSPPSVRLTERGMFFADSVAGLLAWQRSMELRRRPRRSLVTSGDEADVAMEFMG